MQGEVTQVIKLDDAAIEALKASEPNPELDVPAVHPDVQRACRAVVSEACQYKPTHKNRCLQFCSHSVLTAVEQSKEWMERRRG